MNNDYFSEVGNALEDMRLLIEGAVKLYETDTLRLHALAMEHGRLMAATAFDTIGSALYHLQKHIRRLQEEYTKEMVRQVAK